MSKHPAWFQKEMKKMAKIRKLAEQFLKQNPRWSDARALRAAAAALYGPIVD